MSVCLSVCNTPVSCQNGYTYPQTFFQHQVARPSFFRTKRYVNFPTGTSLTEASNAKGMKQELSYRKQIARQLRTQYVEGIYRPKYYTVTVKSRLRVTRGHWKRNHWIDHRSYTT